MEIGSISNEELPKVRTKKIIKWIKNEVQTAAKHGVVYGLSGGIDSAVVAVLCQMAFPDNNLALILPCESLQKDISDAMQIIKKYHINYQKIELTPIYNQILSTIKSNPADQLARANIKPRLRMIILYYYASIFNYLVVGTGNKSEISIGYFTKYGDGGVDILPLGNILKSDIYEIARYLGIPEDIITKPPSAGLWENQTDEKEMGFSYEQLDNYLKNKKLENKEIEEVVTSMVQLSAHKRNRPPSPKV